MPKLQSTTKISGIRKGFFSHEIICHKTQKQTEWWKCALIVMRQYYNIIEKLCLT